MKIAVSILCLVLFLNFSIAHSDNTTAPSPELTKQLQQVKSQNLQLQQRIQQLQTQVQTLNMTNVEQSNRLQRIENWIIERSRPGRIINP